MRRLARARTQWARSQRTRTHPEAAERRRDVAEKVAAARAATVVDERTGYVRAQPVTAGFAEWIDALHGQAGQVLHCFSPQWPQSPANRLAPRSNGAQQNWRSPLAAMPLAAVPRLRTPGPKNPRLGRGQGARGNRARNGGHSALSTLWCQEKNTTRYCGKVAAVKIVTWAPRNRRVTNSR
jgi:hypothetical protein